MVLSATWRTGQSNDPTDSVSPTSITPREYPKKNPSRLMGSALTAALFFAPNTDLKAQTPTPTVIKSPITVNHKQEEKSLDLDKLLDQINAGNLKESFKEALRADIDELKKSSDFNQRWGAFELYIVLGLRKEDPVKNHDLTALLDDVVNVARDAGLSRDEVCIFTRLMKAEVTKLSESGSKLTTNLPNLLKLCNSLKESHPQLFAALEYHNFCVKNIHRLAPLSPAKHEHIKLVRKEFDKAVANGLLPTGCILSPEFYNNHSAIDFFKELEEASQRPGFKLPSDKFMKAVTAINDPYTARVVFMLNQADKLSTEVAIKLIPMIQRHFPHVSSIYVGHSKINAARLDVLGNVILPKVLGDKMQARQTFEYDSDGDLRTEPQQELQARVILACQENDIPYLVERPKWRDITFSIIADKSEVSPIATTNAEASEGTPVGNGDK